MEENAEAVDDGGGEEDGGSGTLAGDGALRLGVLLGDGPVLDPALPRLENGRRKDHSDSN